MNCPALAHEVIRDVTSVLCLASQLNNRVDWQGFYVHDEIDEDESFPLDEDRHWKLSYCGDAAVDSGNVEVLRWILDRAPDDLIKERAITSAAGMGHFEMVTFLSKELHYPMLDLFDPEDANPVHPLVHVVRSCDLEPEKVIPMLKHCIELGADLEPRVLAFAASRNPGPYMFEIMEWLIKEGCPVDGSVCEAVVTGWYHDCTYHQAKACKFPQDILPTQPGGKLCFPLCTLQWLHERSMPVCKDALNAIFKWHSYDKTFDKQMPVIKWLISKGCIPDATTLAAAARAGCLEVLKWLISQGCPCTKLAPVAAASGGHLDVLAWLVDNGVEFDARKCHAAARELQVRARKKNWYYGGIPQTERAEQLLSWGMRNGYWSACGRSAKFFHTVSEAKELQRVLARMSLSEINGTSSLIDSSNVPEVEAVFSITFGGVGEAAD